jgi:hypothetical protein
MTVTVSRYSRPQPFSEESSAPRRQLDGGIPPSADGRGGGQAHPGQRGACPRRPCGCAVLVARPDDVCPEQRPAGIERSGVVAVVDTASRPATGSVAGVQHGVSTIRFRRPVSGRPVSGHPGSSSRASGGRPSAVHPSSVQPSAVHPVRCPAVWCLPPSVRTRPSPPMLRRWRWGPRSGRPGRGRRCRSRVGPWEVGGGPGPPGWVRAAAAALVR